MGTKEAYKYLLYGDTGSGKTHMALSSLKLEHLRPICMINPELKLGTIEDSINVTSDVKQLFSPDFIKHDKINLFMPEESIRSNSVELFTRYNSIIELLCNPKCIYNTQIIDSITRLSQISLHYNANAPRSKSKDTPGLADKLDYKKVRKDMMNIMTHIEAFPGTSIVTAWTLIPDFNSDIPLDNQDLRWCPDLCGKIKFQIPYWFDVCARMESLGSNYMTYLQTTNKYIAKIGSSKPIKTKTLSNATIADLRKLLKEGN